MKSYASCVLAAVIVLGAAALSFSGPEITVDQVLQQYIEALGGQESLEKLSTRLCVGTETTDLRSRKKPVFEEYHVRAQAKSSGKWMMEISTGTGINRHGFDGKTSWVKDDCGSRRAANSGVYQWAFLLDPQGALSLEEYFPELTFAGQQEIDGKQVYAVKPSGCDEELAMLYFDVESGLLLRIGYHWYLEDYREVDGVLFPHRIVRSRKGGSTTTVFETVQHNVKVDESAFSPPVK